MVRVKVLPIAAAILLAGAVLAGSATGAQSPTPSQVDAALRQTQRSQNLWATVNVCAAHRSPHTIGIRAQMPALGFAAQMWARIQVEYWDVHKQHYVAVADPNAHGLVSLGTVSAGLQQGGESFTFAAKHSAYLRATVIFTYRRHGRLLLTLVRHTTGGHPGADQGSPAHFTAATCRI